MFILTTFAMVLLIIRLKVKYGVFSIIHPGMWFAPSWIFALVCYKALDWVGFVPVYDQTSLNELLSFILATGLTFLILTFIGKTPEQLIIKEEKEKSYLYERKLLLCFSLIGLFGSLINWRVLGVWFAYEDSIRQQWLTSIPTITARMWYLYLLTYPAAIAAGWFLINRIAIKNQKKSVSLLTIATPIVAGFFWSLGTGSRQVLGIVILLYCVGAGCGIASRFRYGYILQAKNIKKIFLYFVCSILIFAVFIGLTGLARAKQQGSEEGPFDSFTILVPIGQFLVYAGLSVATYQAYGSPTRRNLTETGPVALAGFQDFGLKSLMGWRAITADDTNPERELASSGFPLAFGTRNLFYDLTADFGYDGALACSIIMALISHIMFLLKTKQKIFGSMLYTAPFGMMLMFWLYSPQFSLLMFNTLYWLMLSSFLWDMSKQIIKTKS